MDILNFISWLKSGRYSATVPANAVTVVGVPTNRRDDKYLPVAVPVSALAGSSGFTHYIGEKFGGGIIVQVWKDSLGIEHGLIASLTNLSTNLPWTVSAYQGGPAIGTTAQSYSDGLTNSNAIVSQTGAAAITYAAGAARLHNDGGFSDWYLPSNWELNACYNSANILNKVLGPTNGFLTSNKYWSSTESGNVNAWEMLFIGGGAAGNSGKNYLAIVRAVRTF